MTGQLLQLVAGSRRTRRTETGLKDTFTKLGEGDTRKRRFSHGPPYIENATDAAKLVGTSLGGKVARARALTHTLAVSNHAPRWYMFDVFNAQCAE